VAPENEGGRPREHSPARTGSLARLDHSHPLNRTALKVKEIAMASRSVKVTVEVPEGTPDGDREAAQNRAHEAAVLSLWEAEHLSTREAAQELGLGYGEFLDLLAARGIPVARGTFDATSVEEARRKLAGGHP
jgi:hypothetical protein